MRIGPTIHYNAGCKLHTYIIVQELMNLQLCICVEIGFLPKDFFVNPFSSVLTIMQDITMYMYMYVHRYRCCLKKHTSGTVGFAPENYNKPQLFR